MPVSLQIQTQRRALASHADDLLRFAHRARLAAGLKGTVSILIDSDQRMQAMNRHFRRKNKPTDVLSFPSTAALQHQHAGDIAISADIASANARALGHSTADEIKILILHGMLHLSGHDHESDTGQMAALERKLRAKLRLPGSLTERAAAPSVTRPAGRKPARMKSRPARRKVAKAPVSRGKQ